MLWRDMHQAVNTISRDPLGDRMKDYESRLVLPRHAYTVLRVDGRAFHTWTRGLSRPYDEGMMAAMLKTARSLCSEISGTVIAFTQSDEISVIAKDFDYDTDGTELLDAQPWFGGVVQKVVSVAASIATAKFNQHFPDRAPALFDARVISLPSAVEAANYLVWRSKDAQRNAISMLAEHHYTAKQLHRVSTARRREMLADADVDLSCIDPRFLYGQTLVAAHRQSTITYIDKRTGESKTSSPVLRRYWDDQPAPAFSAAAGSPLYQLLPEVPGVVRSPS
jgi:tRNA(His) 5'-end guanylyltransferase